MTDLLDTGKHLALEAATASAGAAVLVVSAWPVVGKMYVHQYDTGAIARAAGTWWHLADQIEESQAALRNLPDAHWKATDRTAFDRRAEQYRYELRILADCARTIATVLWSAATLLFAFIVYMTWVAAQLVRLAWTVARAMLAGGLLGFGLAQSGVAIQVTTLFERVVAREAWLNRALHALSAAVGVALDAVVAHTKGGWADLAGATGAQLPELVWGTATRISRDATAKGIGGARHGRTEHG